MAVVDDRGTLVPDADSQIGLGLIGPARDLGGENGDPVDIAPQRELWRRVLAGLARGFDAGKDGANGPVEVVAPGVLGRSEFERHHFGDGGLRAGGSPGLALHPDVRDPLHHRRSGADHRLAPLHGLN